MYVLVGYGDAPGTTGQYFEQALGKEHDTLFVGRSSPHRAGYAPNLDIAAFVAQMEPRPDLFLYIDSGYNPFAPLGLHTVALPTIAYFMDAYPPGSTQRTPYLDTLAPLFDYVFVAHRGAVPHVQTQRANAPVHWLPPCCDAAIHADQHLERTYDVGFVGQVGRAYPQRIELLQAVEQKYRINDFRRSYYREEMARIYSQAKIVVNISHSNAIIPMRFFEAPAAGAMLLTHHSQINGQDELLREGVDYVSFCDLHDALDKIDYYLAHPEEREAIARAGQAAVLGRHTYAHRVAQLLQTVYDDGLRRHAPARRWPSIQVQKTYLQAYSQLRLIDCVMEQPEVGIGARVSSALLALLRRIKHQK